MPLGIATPKTNYTLIAMVEDNRIKFNTSQPITYTMRTFMPFAYDYNITLGPTSNHNIELEVFEPDNGKFNTKEYTVKWYC